MMRNPSGFLKILSSAAIMIFGLFFVMNAAALDDENKVVVHVGRYQIIDFKKPIKRVSIADPEIADATVTSPLQMLLVGKKAGITGMVVWSESDEYTQYKVNVFAEAAEYQVMLKVRFMEIDKTALKEFGSDLLIKNMKVGTATISIGSYGGNVGAPSDPLQLGNIVDFFFSIPSQNISGIFKALMEQNLLTVLAEPNLSAISGQEASILAGGEFPIPVVSGSAGMQMVTIIFKEYGVSLKFTPTVLDSNIINIRVNVVVSSLDFENGVTLSGFTIPALVSRKSDTTVELKENQYLVLGGLVTHEMAKTIAKIPVLGHIPILGALFSSRKFENKESELLITLVPQIVRSQDQNTLPILESLEGKK